MKNKIQALHEQALIAATRHRQSETELIEILKQLDVLRGYRQLNYKSLHEYATLCLRLSYAVAYTLITLARKSRQLPDLGRKIQNQDIPITQAQMVSAVITPQMSSDVQSDWLLKAETLSKRELEKEIKKQFPEKEVQEKIRPVSEKRSELKVGLSEILEMKLKRVQHLESQKQNRSVGLEGALEAMAELYLDRLDPVRKAERAKLREEKTKQNECQEEAREAAANISAANSESHLAPAPPSTPSPPPKFFPVKKMGQITPPPRKPLSAFIKHSLFQRDQGRCVYQNGTTQKPCGSERWVDFHHIQPRSQGGQDQVDNLVTLCREHHRLLHASKNE